MATFLLFDCYVQISYRKAQNLLKLTFFTKKTTMFLYILYFIIYFSWIFFKKYVK